MTKEEKIAIADEVYGWWMIYAQNAGYKKEPVMPYGVWILHVKDCMAKENDNDKR